MSRMLDLVRASALTSHQMMSASKGALHVPGPEMVEILVYIAEHNKIFGEAARLTLAGWDESQCKEIAADPKTAKAVLDYWLVPNNVRAALFPILIENPSVPVSKLSELASTLKGEFVDVLIASPRVRNSSQLLQDLSENHNLSGTQAARVQALKKGEAALLETQEAGEKEKTTAAQAEHAAIPAGNEVPQPSSAMPAAAPALASDAPVQTTPDSVDPEADSALLAFFAQHASEIAAEANKPFQPIGGIYEEIPSDTEPKAAAAAASATSSAATPATTPAASARPAQTQHNFAAHKNPQDEQRGSVLQKINKLDVKGRIQLAMKGTKEERSILIRDGTKMVALAVLDSPKISDGEVEKFATQKNVLEAVLRTIPMKRRFAKNYAVVRNLVSNPRTPLDVALGLMKNLLTADLRNLSGNKEVSETVRKLALRMFKQKSETARKD